MRYRLEFVVDDERTDEQLKEFLKNEEVKDNPHILKGFMTLGKEKRDYYLPCFELPGIHFYVSKIERKRSRYKELYKQ